MKGGGIMGSYTLVFVIAFVCGAVLAGRAITGKWFVFKGVK